MPRSKHPGKKKYVPKYMKGGHLPPPIDISVDWELRAWYALDALKGGRFNQKLGLDLITFLTLCRSVVPNDSTEVLEALYKVFKALNDIKDRHTRTGKWGWSGQERTILLTHVPMFIDLYCQMNRQELADGLVQVEKRLAQVATPGEQQ